ncbi:SAM-dependent methyltransferase [Acetobacter orientalis]|uniref:SAM-dependent methyltransferase n=1 Tax=Acetobacter orientalis TaxID=146474 RepID=UPI00241D2861|nr:SAM-dependent methyltransferase [Acetobacter orientalis]
MSTLSFKSAWLAPEGLESVMEQDLNRRGITIERWHGRLALSSQDSVYCPWALDIWHQPEVVEITSIRHAAETLRAIQRNWSLYAVDCFRRASLIQERLPPVKAAPLVFPTVPPSSPLGAWTLLDAGTLLFSATKSSPFVNGTPEFVEDRIGPPSRAYLKLWEACTRLGYWPQPGEQCLDLGATPGGWTWAIAKLGSTVTAVDRAPLDPKVAAMPTVQFHQGSAFGLEPETLPEVDWVFSDIIAYPKRLLALATRWVNSGRTKHLVLTVKFQGETDHETVAAFEAIPGGHLAHLAQNKHELTFFWHQPAR